MSSPAPMEIFNAAAEVYAFPALDNAHIVLLSANRLHLYLGPSGWAVTIEVFGYHHRMTEPGTTIYTFSNHMIDSSPQDSLEAHAKIEGVSPIKEDWYDEADYDEADYDDVIWGIPRRGLTHITLRGRKIPLSPRADYATAGITLMNPIRLMPSSCSA